MIKTLVSHEAKGGRSTLLFWPHLLLIRKKSSIVPYKNRSYGYVLMMWI